MGNTCWVTNCTTGYKRKKVEKDCERTLSFFTVNPKTDEQLNKWRRAIPRADRQLSFKDLVCEKHFRPNEILWYYETPMPDGTVHRIKRGKPTLLKGAVPSIFPDCPSYLSKNVQKRKSPKKRSSPPEVRKRCKQSTANSDSVCSVPIAAAIDQTSQQDSLPMDIDHISVNNENFSIANFEPPPGWLRNEADDKVLFFKFSRGKIERYFVIDENKKMRFYLNDRMIRITLQEKECTSTAVISEVFEVFSTIKPCQSIAEKNSTCQGFLNIHESSATICYSCRLSQKKQLRKKKYRMDRKVVYNVVKKYNRSKKKINLLNSALRIQKKCAKAAAEKIAQYENLSPVQAEMISSCLRAAKLKSSKQKKGMRYTTLWIYECCLMRIKCSSLYESLRKKGIMPLPSPSTLYRYMKGLKPAYGFQKNVFEMMREKFKNFSPLERRGIILFDEMKIVPNVVLDRTSMKINGFTHLGDYTPSSQKGVPGDHALVFMIQPFVGGWVQPIAAFLSKGAASGQVLSHLLIEAITLMENTRFHIDGVVSDAATWNRAMWKIFNIDAQNPTCAHIVDPERKLFFFSDFPHLLKNVRNWIQKTKLFSTPDGIVKTEHWEKLVSYDQIKHGKFGVKLCPKLSSNHLHPKHYAKMNVALAYQFFGIDVAAAMKSLANKKDSPFGEVVKGTYSLIYKVNSLIKAMSSRCPKGALYNECKEYKDISNFISFLLMWKEDNDKRIQRMDEIPNTPILADSAEFDPEDDWDEFEPENQLSDDECFEFYNESLDCYGYGSDEEDDDDLESNEDDNNGDDDTDGEENDKNTEKERKKQIKQAEKESELLRKMAKNDIRKQFLTDNTFVGLSVTLTNTLGLFTYLREKYGFKYLMTSRLNQDRLEAFFGMVRGHCGSGSHPTSTMFIQIYRLLSVYALVRPPKGSNVEDSATASTLLHVKNLKKSSPKNTEWQTLLDDLVEKGVDVSGEDGLFDNVDEALEYLGGYVARKAQKFSKCENCREKLICQENLIDNASPSSKEDTYLECRDFVDGRGLYLPSKPLLHLCHIVEKHLGEEMKTTNSTINQNIVTNVVRRMTLGGTVPLIGCSDESHRRSLTKKIICFLVLCRTHFICKTINSEIKNEARVKGLSKASKY